MLKLLEQQVLVTELPRKFLALRLFPLGDVDQRDDLIDLPRVLILDDAGMEAFVASFSPPILDGDIAPLDPAELG